MSRKIISKKDALPIDIKMRASKIRLLLLDVDGVLTDGRLFLGPNEMELKQFHSHDGHGIKLLQRSGIKAAILSGRQSAAVSRRAVELGIEHCLQGIGEKWPACEMLMRTVGCESEHIAYVGDDTPDLPVLEHVGLAVAVQNAHESVKQSAHWITQKNGGEGAVRELCDLILHAQDKYDDALRGHGQHT